MSTSDALGQNPSISFSSTSSATHAPSQARSLDFQFHGQGWEYFRIWIVNIVLTVLTLGIYSAWAKVRNKQYFYGNTELDGASFTYDARPIQILKGRLLVLGVFVLISILSSVMPILAAIVPFVFLLLLPFFMQRSLQFNARYSSYRHVRFGFDGTYKELAMIVLGWPVLFALAAGALLGLGGLIGGEALSGVLAVIVFLASVFGLSPYLFYRFKQCAISRSRYGTAPFRFTARLRPFVLITLQSVLLSFLLLLALIATLKIVVGSSEDLALLFGEMGSPEPMLGAVLPTLILMFGLFVLFANLPYVYFVVKTNNLVFNHSAIERIEFRANYTLGAYLWLYVSNAVLTLLTLGLFWPFAKVRMARYRAQHTHIIAAQSLDDFSAAQAEKVGALGEAVSDFYDFDFGF